MDPLVRFKVLEIEEPVVRQRYLSAIEKVYMHGRFILGPEIAELEDNLCELTNRKYCVTVSNGTMALFISLLVLARESPNKKEVILPAYGWIASANAIKAAGLQPVFADIDSQFFLSVDSVAALISANTLAIMPVNFTGRIGSNVWQLDNLSKKTNIPIIEDCAQAFGAWNSSNPEKKLFSSGSTGKVSCFSINPMKTLSSHGEGGAILTDDSSIASFARQYRYQGMESGSYVGLGINARMETLQAAIVLENLSVYEQVIDQKREIAFTYNQAFSSYCTIPKEDISEQHTYFSYQILSPWRDALREFLLDSRIEVQVQHHPLMCDTPAHNKARRGSLETAKRISNQSLCLPCHEKMSEEQVQYVIAKTVNFLRNK